MYPKRILLILAKTYSADLHRTYPANVITQTHIFLTLDTETFPTDVATQTHTLLIQDREKYPAEVYPADVAAQTPHVGDIIQLMHSLRGVHRNIP
jgi:hypothetical protein